MKIYLNDVCPCGSGKKYKKCCAKKAINDDFIVNSKGAIVFKDESKQPILELPEGKTQKTVLSVGLSHSLRPLVTIQEEKGPICYVLPDWFTSWCTTCVYMSRSGINIFPSDVIFTHIDNKYAVDVL